MSTLIFRVTDTQNIILRKCLCDCEVKIRMASTSKEGKMGPAALTVGSVLCGTILNHVSFIGHYRGQLIQQPMKMTQFRMVRHRTDPTVRAMAP